MSENVRVRFAPSPTGLLHVGGARTALYNWAFARRHGGDFILRIDDTDPERSTDENKAAILRGLGWLGLDWDEGPDIGGDRGPYLQTERGDRYAEGLERLKSAGAAYPCFCSAEALADRREAARERGSNTGYDRKCRSLEAAEALERVSSGEPHVWRLKVPEDRGDIAVEDAVRGPLSFPASAMDDFVLVRSDATPTYNLATVLDDIDMEITHVIRGDDHVSNTPRQALVYEALGHPLPVFAHLPMIWGPDGKRLSKRHGAASVQEYEEMGYLPEAVLNYLSLLGWSLDGETTVIDKDTLVESFSLDRISKNPAVLDNDKLEWLNGVYIRELSSDELVARMLPWLEEAGLSSANDVASRKEWFLELAVLVSERIRRMDELVPTVRFLFEDVPTAEEARDNVLAKEGSARALAAVAETLSVLPTWDAAAIEKALRSVPAEVELKGKQVFQATRVAATGTTVSPPLFESLALLGRERTLERIDAAQGLATA